MPVIAAALLVCVLSLPGCGGKREIPPEETGQPNTLPPEQILYRQARDTFQKWLTEFGSDDRTADLYPLLTYRSRAILRKSGIASAARFNTWFTDLRARDMTPFNYRFERPDILDIDIRDTGRAVITATFVLHVFGKEFESVGSFFLIREQGAWKVPFAESGEWQRSWWQQDRGFGTRVREEGLTRYTSRSLGIEIEYPIAWDVAENAPRAPGAGSQPTGVELKYLNPGTMRTEARVSISAAPIAGNEAMIAGIDTSAISGFQVVRKEDATATNETLFTGKTYWIYDRKNSRFLVAFAGVDQEITPYSTFASILSSIIASFSLPE